MMFMFLDFSNGGLVNDEDVINKFSSSSIPCCCALNIFELVRVHVVQDLHVLFKNVLFFTFFVFLKPHIQNSHPFLSIYSYTVERDVKSGYFRILTNQLLP